MHVLHYSAGEKKLFVRQAHVEWEGAFAEDREAGTQAKVTPDTATIVKIDKALKRAERKLKKSGRYS